jgi:hypothetical protein
MMVVPSSPQAHDLTQTTEWKDKWRVIGRKEDVTFSNDGDDNVIGQKRKDIEELSEDAPVGKRIKLDPASEPPQTTATALSTTNDGSSTIPPTRAPMCKAPPPNPIAQTIIHAILNTTTNALVDTDSTSTLQGG